MHFIVYVLNVTICFFSHQHFTSWNKTVRQLPNIAKVADTDVFDITNIRWYWAQWLRITIAFYGGRAHRQLLAREVCVRARMSNAFDRSDSIAVAPFCCSLRDTIVSEADTHTSLLLLEIWFNYVICLIFGQMRSRATMQIYFNGNATKQKKTKRGKNNRSQTGANEEIKIFVASLASSSSPPLPVSFVGPRLIG